MARYEWVALRPCKHRDAFGRIRSGIECTVGDMKAWGFRADFLSDCIQELLLSEWTIVGDIICLTDRRVVLQREQEPWTTSVT